MRICAAIVLISFMLSALCAQVSVDVPIDTTAPQQFYRAVAIPEPQQAAPVFRAGLYDNFGRWTPLPSPAIPEPQPLPRSAPTIETNALPPILVKAVRLKGIRATLVWTHNTGTSFSIKVVHQNEEEAGPRVYFGPAKASSPIPGVWTADVTLLGDTNVISVTVAGSTNFSNSLTVIP